MAEEVAADSRGLESFDFFFARRSASANTCHRVSESAVGVRALVVTRVCAYERSRHNQKHSKFAHVRETMSLVLTLCVFV